MTSSETTPPNNAGTPSSLAAFRGLTGRPKCKTHPRARARVYSSIAIVRQSLAAAKRRVRIAPEAQTVLCRRRRGAERE